MVKNERKCTWMNVKPALLILSALFFLTLIFFVKTTTVMAADDVCQIGTIKYTTLDDAITDANKATSAVTITMVKDVKINTKLIINNVNNKKITITSTDETSPNKVTFDAAASFSVSTDFTLNQLILSGGDKPESVGRTTAAITITGGTTTVQGTGYDQDYNNYSIIENFGKSDTICAGGVFNVSGDNTVLNLKSGSIKNCIANSDANEVGYDAKNGGAVLYMNGGTVLLSDMYIFYCGVGDGSDFTPGICSGPVCVKKGTFKMTGGSINNCIGGCGGAISLWSGATADISGGVFNSNQAAKDGGAVYAASGSTLNISGSVWIKDNVCSGANEGASAIAYREGAKISIKGSPVIAGNRTDCLDTGKSAAICCADAYDPVTFNAEDADGSITISGSPTIRNNTCGSQENGSPADLAVYSAATLTVGNMDAKLATVGICSPLDESFLKNGSQFAAALSGTAAETTNLQAFFCDKNPVNHEALVGSAGEGSDVIWKKIPYVCKIVTNNAATVYLTLQDALDAVPNEGSATIEMLVENYEIKTQQNVGSNEGERNITITTASENAADGYSYTGKSGTKAALTRTATCTALYLNNRTTLTLTNIELKDNVLRTPTAADMCRLIMADGESDARVTVNMSSGAVVTGGDNGKGNTLGYNTTGAGLYLKFTTLNMTGDAVISGCKGDSGSAIYAIGSTVNMSGTSAITECTSYELGAVTLATDTAISTEPSSFTMSENSKITNNTGTLARASAVYFYGDSAKHVFTMEGNAEISGNTVNKTRTNDPKYAATVSADCAAADITMSGNAVIKNNVVKNPDAQSSGGISLSMGCSLTMSDYSSITGNGTQSAGDTDVTSTSGGVNVLPGESSYSDGTITISGNVNITGNTCLNGSQNADLTLPNNATTLKVNELSENASVGIYSSGGSTDNILQNGARFAAVTAKYATQVDNLDIFFNNATAVRGSAGVGQAVVWGTGELTVSNTTAGDGADTTKPFGFTLKGLQEDGLSYTGYIYKTSDPGKSLRSYTFNSSSHAFALANDEFMRILELPVGSSLTVTETDAEASGGSTSVYKGSIKKGTDSKTEFTISDLAAVTPQGGLACGASSLSVSNTRNSVALTGVTEADNSSVYRTTAEKNFKITGVDSAYTAVWCNADGSTKDAPKSAGTFKPGNVTSGQSDLTLTPTAGAGTYYFKVSDGGLSSNVMTYTITQIPVTITGLEAADKAYDGSTAAIVTGTSSLNGIFSGDNVSVINGNASFADKNAGTNKTVSYSGYSLAGTDAANYILTAQPAPVTASISTVSITVTPDSGQYKKIGNAEPSFTYTSSGAAGKEEPSFKGALSRDAGETIGDYAILIGSLALTDNGSSFTAANYTLQFTSGVTFEIGKGDVSETKLFADFGIIKKDADNQAPIEATFTLSGTDCKNSRVNITGTTDAASGQATFSNVPVGLLSDGTRQPYTLTETGADGYITAGPWDVLADTDQDGNEIISIKLHSAPDTDYQLITGKKGPDGYPISSTQTLLTIKKIDNQANPLTGAIMKIEGDFADGTNEKSISNNEANALKGVFISGNKYTLTETVRPEGYEGFYDKIIFHLDNTGKALIDSNSDLSDGQAAAAVSPDGTVISLRNLSYTGSVTLTKKDFEDNTVLLKGVHYCLYKEKVSGTQDVTKDTKITVNGSAEFTTDSNGQITIIDLSEGTYYFVEQSTITGYELDSEVQKPFAIDDTDNAHDHAVSVAYTNKKLLDITITVDWIDAEDAYAMRPDSTAFTLYADGVRVTPQPAALASPVKAGNTWTYTLTGLQKYKTGTGDMIVYTVKEEPVTNYKANSDTVVVKNGTASFTNTLSLETAIATVTDYSENTSEKTLSGAGYILVRKNADGTLSYFTGNDTATGMALWGSKSAEAKLLTAGTDGTASVSGLYTGSYYFLQTEAPSGYLINSTPITFEVTTAGSKTISTTQANKMITSSFGSTVKGAMTGDGSGILVWLLIILAAFAAGGYALYGRRKH